MERGDLEVFDPWHSFLCSQYSCLIASEGISEKDCNGVGLRILVTRTVSSGVPRNFAREGGSTNSVQDRGQREPGSGGGSPLVRGSGGSCNLVQAISFHIVKFS